MFVISYFYWSWKEAGEQNVWNIEISSANLHNTLKVIKINNLIFSELKKKDIRRSGLSPIDAIIQIRQRILKPFKVVWGFLVWFSKSHFSEKARDKDEGRKSTGS